MTDHPSTFRGESARPAGIEWDDRASLHREGDAEGVLDAATALRSGSFAELIGHMMLLPEAERAQYYIEKAGDREYHADEVAGLSRRADFPRA